MGFAETETAGGWDTSFQEMCGSGVDEGQGYGGSEKRLWSELGVVVQKQVHVLPAALLGPCELILEN